MVCWRFVCQSGQLVKMTAEELASKELAEWREREAKHQLEIIQKTELELMTMPAKYLVKSHKGEEIIEDKSSESTRVNKSEDSDAAVAPVLEMLQDTTSKHKSHFFDLNCQICSGKLKEEEEESSSRTPPGEHRKRHQSEADKRKDKQAGHRDKDKNRPSSRKKDNSKDVKDVKDVKEGGKNHHHHHSTKSREKERQKRGRSKERHHNKHRSDRTDKKDVKEEAKEVVKESKDVIQDVKDVEPTPPTPAIALEEKCDSNSASESVQSSQCSSVDNKTASTDVVDVVVVKKEEMASSKPASNQPKQEPTSTVSIR